MDRRRGAGDWGGATEPANETNPNERQAGSRSPAPVSPPTADRAHESAVATESGRPLGEAPGVTETEISVVTLAELTVGVLMATDANRADRLATLSAVESTWDPLPVDAEVARAFARIVAELHRRAELKGGELRTRRRRMPVLDALVAATAVVERIPIVTQDRDYEDIPDVEVIQV
jgi:predicted nucleic acid-binding protein